MRSRTDLTQAVAAFARRYAMLPEGSTVLCALSGGADSMALLTVLEELSAPLGLTVLAAHYNHRLRGEESRRDEAFVVSWCGQRGISLYTGAGDVAEEAARRGRGVEETARTLRYAFLEETAQRAGAERIATAHNADDNGETVLLHLVRGAGLAGLTGIPPVRGPIVRPLLTQTHRELEAYLQEKGIPHVEDSSNADPTYARNRLRREVLPVLRTINPHFAHTLAAGLEGLREDQAFLQAWGAQALGEVEETEDGVVLPARRLAEAPGPVAMRMARQLLHRMGLTQYSAAHLQAVVEMARSPRPGVQRDLPGGISVRREYDQLRLFHRRESESPPPKVPLAQKGRTPWGNWEVTCQACLCPLRPEQSGAVCYLAKGAPVWPAELRTRQTGDTLRLPGRPQKTIKKWYIDEKIPRQIRETLPVVAGPAGVLAAGGLGPQADWIAQPGEPAWKLTFAPRSMKTERKGSTK